jgi:hypothetical protein
MVENLLEYRTRKVQPKPSRPMTVDSGLVAGGEEERLRHSAEKTGKRTKAKAGRTATSPANNVATGHPGHGNRQDPAFWHTFTNP